MNIYMLWAQSESGGDLWLIDAWDSDSIDSNSFGWEEAKKKAYDQHGADNVRITYTQVDYESLRKAFEPVSIHKP